jgi:hypothetical protein
MLPEYTQITLQGYPISNHLMTPQIFIYPVAELKVVNEGSDGKYYVAAVLPVNHPSLPADGNVTGNEPSEFTSDFPTYLANVVASLNPQVANTFTPDLTQLDTMMSSLEVK